MKVVMQRILWALAGVVLVLLVGRGIARQMGLIDTPGGRSASSGAGVPAADTVDSPVVKSFEATLDEVGTGRQKPPLYYTAYDSSYVRDGTLFIRVGHVLKEDALGLCELALHQWSQRQEYGIEQVKVLMITPGGDFAKAWSETDGDGAASCR